MIVTIFDYGAGNLHSLIKALEMGDASQRAQVRVEANPSLAVCDTDALVLPGVGAFAPAAARLAPGRDAMREAIVGGLPCLAICLGMQLLFDHSDEGEGAGLGIIPGAVTRLRATRLPQIGWNAVTAAGEVDPLLAQSGLDMAYYANSFACRPDAARLDAVVAWSEHEGDRFPAIVRSGRVVGTQFHPEKSSRPGLRFLQAFLGSRASHINHSTESMP